MDFELVSTSFFREQFESLLMGERQKIQKRLILLKENPFRNKSIYSKKFGRVFRVRIEIEKIEKRIIYVIFGSKIAIAGMTNRGDNYKDLEELLEKVIKELNSYK